MRCLVKCNAVIANWTVREEQKWFGHGYSSIVGTSGNIIAKASKSLGDQIIVGDIPVSDNNEIQKIPFRVRCFLMFSLVAVGWTPLLCSKKFMRVEMYKTK